MAYALAVEDANENPKATWLFGEGSWRGWVAEKLDDLLSV